MYAYEFRSQEEAEASRRLDVCYGLKAGCLKNILIGLGALSRSQWTPYFSHPLRGEQAAFDAAPSLSVTPSLLYLAFFGILESRLPDRARRLETLSSTSGSTRM